MVDFTDKAIEWTEERYCLSVFREKRFTLPAVIKITSGYYGRTNFEEFYSDEILILYEWFREERIMARNQKKLTISIPVDFDHTFHVQTPDGSIKKMPLSKVVKDYNPPVTVGFDPNSEVSFFANDEPFSSKGFGPLTLLSSHYLEYVTASTTINGRVSLQQLICLPVYRKVRFMVAQKLQGLEVDDLKQHLTSYMDMTQNLRTKQKNTFPGREEFTEHKLGIVDYNEMLDTLEDYAYLRLVPTGPWGKIANQENRPGNKKSPAEHFSRFLMGGGEKKKNEYEHLRQGDVQPDQAVTPKSPLLFPHNQEVQVEVHKGPISPTTPRPNIRYPQIPLVLPNKLSNMGSIHQYQPLAPKVESSREPQGEDSKRPPIPKREPLPKRDGSKRVVHSPKVELPHQGTIPLSAQSPQVLSSSISSIKKVLEGQNMGLFKREPLVGKVPPVPKRQPIQPSSGGQSPRILTTSSLSLQEVPEDRSIPPSSGGQSPRILTTSFSSLEEVPEDRSTLTVGEMCQCLSLLKMDEHIPKFKHMQVDGRLLKNCSISNLVEDFDMSKIAAMKLKMFSDEGWYPMD